MDYKAPKIKVMGTGIQTVVPTQGVITLGVVTDGKSLSTIQQENSLSTSRVIQSLLQLGVEKNDIQTTQYRVDPIYEYNENQPLLLGYKVTHLLQVKISDLKNVGIIIDTAVQNGVNSVSDLRFEVLNRDAIYNRALQKAFLQAKQKAFDLSRVMGVNIHPTPISITENYQEVIRPTPYAVSLAETTPIMPGQQEITANIHVEFLYT
ncbi:SIMPL domain-containing protein [Bacillus salitolerans]|uniref:SIMPL domain-containing protein n=1 Tax=Bacillus salitolerans TaxID=1437434 RepID=A0ABW4LPY6_9BACI